MGHVSSTHMPALSKCCCSYTSPKIFPSVFQMVSKGSEFLSTGKTMHYSRTVVSLSFTFVVSVVVLYLFYIFANYTHKFVIKKMQAKNAIRDDDYNTREEASRETMVVI